MSRNRILIVVLSLALGVVPVVLAGEVAGAVVTPGRMLVNGMTVQGNATVMEGAVLKTTSTAARVELAGGSVVSLDANSEAVVRTRAVELRRGRGMVASDAAGIDALGLRVNSAAPRSQVLVAVAGGVVEVAAVRGEGLVSNGRGIPLAMIRGGKPLRFEPAAGPEESLMSGRLRRDGARFMLRDELTGLDIEVRGKGLGDYESARVEVGGKAVSEGAGGGQIVLASRLNRLEAEGAHNAGSASPSSASSARAKPRAAESGMSAGTKIGIAALAFGGMAAAIVVPLSMSN